MSIRTSKRLIQSIPAIMDVWEKKALEKIKEAHKHESFALRDSLPEFIAEIAQTLATSARPLSNKSNNEITARMGKKHGRDRANTTYTMNQMILEYHILRLAIFEVLEKTATLSLSEAEVIITAVEQAVSGAATEFSATLNELQEQLAHTLAHDLRNPVMAAKVSAQLIQRRPEDVDNAMNAATRISICMDRLDKMISDLLDVSRVRSGSDLILEFLECDLDWLVREVANELNMADTGRFVVESHGKCIGFWNESGIRRLIENLSINALKHGIENGTVTITLSQDEFYAMIKVHNHGDHLTAKEQEIIFEPFQRSKSAENKVGWGLGLSMVKGMVVAHKGTITIESEKKKGTTFIIKLPKYSKEMEQAKQSNDYQVLHK